MATAAAIRKKAAEERADLMPDDLSEVIDPASLLPALQSIRASLNISGDMPVSVYVYKVNHDGEGNDFRVWESDDPESFVLKNIARRFGSGSYRVRVYVTDDSGMKTMRVNSIQHVLLDPDEESKAVAAREAAKNPPAQVAHNGHDFAALAEVMRAGFDSLRAAPAPDPFAMVERLAGVMKVMAPAPVAAAVDPMSNIKSTLELIALLKGAAGGDGMSASEQLLMKAADSFMPALASGLAGKQPTVQSAAQAAPALAGPAEPLNEEQDDMQIMAQLKFQAFKMQLKAANKAAARGVPADQYADTIYDAFEDDDIRGLATESAWFELMCNAVPECTQHQTWYAAVRLAVIEMAIEDGLLVRDAGGGLTAAPDSGTTGIDSEPGVANGVVGTGNTDTGAIDA